MNYTLQNNELDNRSTNKITYKNEEKNGQFKSNCFTEELDRYSKH